VEQRSEKHSHARVGLKEDPSMSEHQEIISREHIRVARHELPWVSAPNETATLTAEIYRDEIIRHLLVIGLGPFR